MVKRQLIVTWYKPEEKLPPEDQTVVCTISGKVKGQNMIYVKALFELEYDKKCGWCSEQCEFEDLTVHGWCDLDPFKG